MQAENSNHILNGLETVKSRAPDDLVQHRNFSFIRKDLSKHIDIYLVFTSLRAFPMPIESRSCRCRLLKIFWPHGKSNAWNSYICKVGIL